MIKIFVWIYLRYYSTESHDLLDCTNDLYNVHQIRENIDIKTHYEKISRNEELL